MEAVVTSALREHAPFDEMGADALRFLAARLALAYYPRGELVVGPESGTVARLYIVKQGRVRGVGSPAEVVLGPGECFPLGALIGRRATVYRYEAKSDCFCWELAASDFQALLERSARFRAFCTDHLAALLERSQRALRAEAARSAVDDAGMLAPLRTLLKRKPVSCPGETTLGEVLATMKRERVGSMVVVDELARPRGIFTSQDVLERVAVPQLSVDVPASSVMTANPFALEEDATIADAALAMARRRIRHIVVTRDGKLAGVVSERDLFALQRVGLARTAERIASASKIGDLVEAAGDIRRLAHQLLAQGLGADALTATISALNDSLTQHVIALAAQRHSVQGGWCWLALGSEGRMEQTLVTDQDNALIFSQGDKAFLLRFADEVNRNLDACGFPLCKGDIMARNPRWCLGEEEWRALFGEWIGNPDPEALLNASIFFDFRALAGEASLAGALRERVLAQTQANRSFCRAMAESALRTRPPLGLLSDFTAPELDLKLLGARPLADAARVLALAQGSRETGTAPRLRGAGESTAVAAFHFVQTLRLRNGANRVEVEKLNSIDRRLLKEAFRQAALLQERLRLDFAL